MSRLKKEEYVSESTKQLEIEYKNKVKQDKNRAMATRVVDKIPEDLRQDVLDILSRELATKGEAANTK